MLLLFYSTVTSSQRPLILPYFCNVYHEAIIIVMS